MSSYYRERRAAGVYDADEDKREKAGAKFDKQWNAQMDAEAEEETTSGTASPNK